MSDLDRAAQTYLGSYLNVSDLTGNSLAVGAKAILAGEGEELPSLLRGAGRSGLLLLAVALLCGFAETARQELGPGGLDPARLAGATAVTIIAAADVHTLLGLGREALGHMDTFSQLLMPVMTGVCAAAGAPTAAVVRQGATLLFLTLLLRLTDALVVPMLYGYIAASAAWAALGNDGLKRLGKLLKWVAGTVLTTLITVFVFYLTVSGAVAGSADALAQKTAKTMLSGMIPVVGGILADAAETVVAGAGALKGTVGVLGMLAVLGICIGPFLRIGVHYLMYKAVAALTATVTEGPTAALMDDLGSAFALMLGAVGGGGAILYVALITSVQTAAGG